MPCAGVVERREDKRAAVGARLSRAQEREVLARTIVSNLLLRRCPIRQEDAVCEGACLRRLAKRRTGPCGGAKGYLMLFPRSAEFGLIRWCHDLLTLTGC